MIRRRWRPPPNYVFKIHLCVEDEATQQEYRLCNSKRRRDKGRLFRPPAKAPK